MKIHPTAIIDPKAELHESVEVGPFCIIEKDVKIGEGTVIESHVKILSGTRIGKFNKLSSGGSYGGLPQDLAFKPETKTYLEIGDHNHFRENVILHRGTVEGKATTIGNHNYLMGNVHLAHDVIVGDHNIMVQNTMLAGHVVIGHKVFISGSVGVHQFVRVSDYAMLAGLTKVVKDVPPYATVDGHPGAVVSLNVVGMKRAGISADVRLAIKRVYKVIYHSGLNTKQALTELKKDTNPAPEVQKIIEFFESSKRGVVDHRFVSGGSDEE
ncbi:acyl-ACP--UDP-N-acetylglucosamine O-acyltransferase [Leptospira meyeri]|uniref:Acyl-[acyl-carrier-protein]--UDP-N-acetylglucosamine O-acyltransferase n=1 Tax=Leptospira meyeri TaxID=29508 RepID=A0A4R8MU56_LEPME|nr:acyl-ACP--UDP-N-acetylglucosamine O-acyltransferase [Leptospira meyeri]EKJ86457.1 acyl-[acyl-carrier-protein]-UDP-N-acetylglucosamine O-acyltransferase [Leptospira meyeri serovar Hardjo str. Went 5]EMJ89016.1 acyl-[acyl-carrier-protein]-UDP-N-acetylglucosamine O-acyltransferase [Leptospira meyeri serovar Semaranga str. Veldrot Semarang 173]TDY72873.1 acyl-[acyl-carrier-protein]--UDP-N-acetylglucosamine O-acyltransferase [Leptospira meyeri]TGL50965.1 acyl-ACP--UDP-N-acetylglucosamine O-acyltr